MTNIIDGEILERAEASLARTYEVAVGAPAHERVLMKAQVDSEAYDRFAAHHRAILFKKYVPNIDPRDESAVMTMLLHFFAMGAMAQRIKRNDEVA